MLDHYKLVYNYIPMLTTCLTTKTNCAENYYKHYLLSLICSYTIHGRQFPYSYSYKLLVAYLSCRKLSLEVDRLLQDIEPLIQDASSEPLIQDASSVPTGIKMSISSEESNEDMSSFDDDEELQTRLDEAEKRKDSLAMELETFIDQIKQLHSGFQGLKEGNRLSPLTHHVIYTENNNENGQRSTSLDDCITHRRNDTLNQRHNAGRLSTVW